MSASDQHSKAQVIEDKPVLRRWIGEMRARDEFPDTDLKLMDAIERLLDDHDSLFEQLETERTSRFNLHASVLGLYDYAVDNGPPELKKAIEDILDAYPASEPAPNLVIDRKSSQLASEVSNQEHVPQERE